MIAALIIAVCAGLVALVWIIGRAIADAFRDLE